MLIRVLIVAGLFFVTIIAIPITGLLRSSEAAAPNVCEQYSRAVWEIATRRDMGIPAGVLAQKAAALREEGRLTAEQYSAVMELIIEVYSTDETPESLRLDALRWCKKNRIEA